MADNSNSAAVEIAREANAHILAMDARLHEVSAHARETDDEPVGLFCECGCMGIVNSTPVEYSANGGAWLEGHELA